MHKLSAILCGMALLLGYQLFQKSSLPCWGGC